MAVAVRDSVSGPTRPAVALLPEQLGYVAHRDGAAEPLFERRELGAAEDALAHGGGDFEAARGEDRKDGLRRSVSLPPGAPYVPFAMRSSRIARAAAWSCEAAKRSVGVA